MFPFWIEFPAASLVHWLPFAVAALTLWLTAGTGRGCRA